jgi:hypothetical protein
MAIKEKVKKLREALQNKTLNSILPKNTYINIFKMQGVNGLDGLLASEVAKKMIGAKNIADLKDGYRLIKVKDNLFIVNDDNKIYFGAGIDSDTQREIAINKFDHRLVQNQVKSGEQTIEELKDELIDLIENSKTITIPSAIKPTNDERLYLINGFLIPENGKLGYRLDIEVTADTKDKVFEIDRRAKLELYKDYPQDYIGTLEIDNPEVEKAVSFYKTITSAKYSKLSIDPKLLKDVMSFVDTSNPKIELNFAYYDATNKYLVGTDSRRIVKTKIDLGKDDLWLHKKYLVAGKYKEVVEIDKQGEMHIVKGGNMYYGVKPHSLNYPDYERIFRPKEVTLKAKIQVNKKDIPKQHYIGFDFIHTKDNIVDVYIVPDDYSIHDPDKSKLKKIGTMTIDKDIVDKDVIVVNPYFIELFFNKDIEFSFTPRNTGTDDIPINIKYGKLESVIMPVIMG